MKFVYVVIPSMVVEAAFIDISKMIFHIDFKYGSKDVKELSSIIFLLESLAKLCNILDGSIKQKK